jgi:hypothetical protein
MSRLTLPRVTDPATQRALDKVVEELNRTEHHDIKADLSATEVLVRHGLGRVPAGWTIIDKDADARVWRSSDATSVHLPLTASATVKTTVRIF